MKQSPYNVLTMGLYVRMRITLHGTVAVKRSDRSWAQTTRDTFIG